MVPRIYQHFYFEQSKFKNDFIVMKQKARQKAASSVEQDFYKLLEKSNFGIDCRNNIENGVLEPIYHEIGGRAFIKKCDDIFNNERYLQFSDPDIMTQEVSDKFSLGLW